MRWFDDLQRRQRSTSAGADPRRPPLPEWLQGAPRLALLAAAAAVFLICYYGLFGWLASEVDPDLSVRPPAAILPPGGSVTVAMAATLMTRELDGGWTPNDSMLAPTALLNNRPAFQVGVHGTVAALVPVLGDSNQLRDAASALGAPADRWWLHGGFPWIGGGAEQSYRDAVEALARYNLRVGEGLASFERSPARLIALLDQLALRLTQVAAPSERAIRGRAGPADRPLDEQFYLVRGSAYAAALLLRAMRDDYGPLVRANELAGTWNEATEALDAVVALDPLAVSTDDLTRQGYHLLLARGKLRDLAMRLQAMQ